MAKPGAGGIKRIINAAGYSYQGLKAAWKNEAAFRQELMMVVVAVPIAYWLAESTYDFLWLVLPLFMIVFAELINSAIEAVVDRIGDEHHELAGRAKDIGSALVFISFVFMAVVWLMLLI